MPERNFENRTLYHGDNLDFLRGMNSETVNLIATDPPFNKSRDFHATPDSLARGASFQDRWSWQDDIHDEWLIQIQRDEPEVWQVINAAKQVWGDDMAAFLCWLGVRLLEMHRILADDGSLYLHIDHTAHAWVKCLMDAIFGRRNFRNEIVWAYTGPSNTTRWFPRKHDTLLFYVKSDDAPFYRDAVRIPYKQLNIQHQEEGGGGIGGNLTPDTVGGYRERGKVPEDYWLEDRDGMTPVGRLAGERTGYPTQKPLALYERIIKASSDEDDLVLDPFCGCATTPVAAERQGRQWVGMDIWDGAHQLVLDRLESEGLAVRGRRRSQLLTFGDITYSTTPPNGQTQEKPRRWCYEPQQDGRSVSLRPERIMGGFWPTSGRCARVAARTTPLTRVCWRLTTSTRAPRAGRTLTTISPCCARRATRKSATATR